MYSITRSTALMALLACLLAARVAPAQAPAIPPFNRADTPGEPPQVPGTEGEVQGRGPIHEGFAQPGSGVGRPAPTVPKQPPAPIPETPPDQRPAGDDVAWIPGYWGWDEDRRDFLWVSGFWRVLPAGRTWVPGYWAKTDDGYRWVSGLWEASAQAQVPYVPAPPESLDRGPSLPPPEAGCAYVPGTWLRDESRWLWRPGYYVAPRDGLVYSPSRYVWTPRGYLFAPGFWDRPLDSRGVLFAPVYFGADFAPPADWSYRPNFAVDIGVALGSLWVGPGANSYAFGDYYAPRYARAGYQSWLAYGPAARDPLYGYYRHANRDNPSWRGNLVDTHNGRLRGTISAPPSTFAAQGRVRDASLRTVTPLSSYRNRSLRMANVTPADRRDRANAASAPRRVTEARSAPYSTPSQRSPYAGYTLSPPRETARHATPAPTARVAPRTTPRSIAAPRSYTPPVHHTTPAPIARPRPIQTAAPRHTPPAHHYRPPAQVRHAPPVQLYTPPPQARHTPPARSAPPAHTSAKHRR
jgi:WXXGXW repeat (2 copies)